MALGDYILCCKCEVKLIYDGDRSQREWWEERFGKPPQIECPDCKPKREPIETQREKVAQWMIDRGYATGHGDTIEDLLKELEWQIREGEREACAKVCEKDGLLWGNRYATAIRARGKK